MAQQGHTQKQTIKKPTCSNCGVYGHHYRSCIAPVTSYGVIAFRIPEESWNQADSLSKNDQDLNGLPEKSIEFLLIQRRDSIGFIELIRAKYKLTELDYICEQISGTTQKERTALLTKTFHELWVTLWGPLTHGENKQYKQEYDQAKVKFEALQEGFEIDSVVYTLKGLIDEMPVLWTTPEWGFPKGRRNAYESDQQCAIREFQEETGLNQSQYRIFENIEPIRETFFGNNKIHYCHVYYLAWISSSVQIKMNEKSEIMSREVGNIGWFSIESSFEKIRSTNLEKREILLRVSSLLKNLCPMLVGPVSSSAKFHQKEDDLFNRNRTDVKSGDELRGGIQQPVWGREPGGVPQSSFGGGGTGGGTGGGSGGGTGGSDASWTTITRRSNKQINKPGHFNFVED